MDVSPISAIRPATAIRPLRVAPDLSRVFEVEYLGQSSEDEYTHADSKEARGMEDEEAESAEAPDAGVENGESVDGSSSVSCFA